MRGVLDKTFLSEFIVTNDPAFDTIGDMDCDFHDALIQQVPTRELDTSFEHTRACKVRATPIPNALAA